jgi:hypothetical protein
LGSRNAGRIVGEVRAEGIEVLGGGDVLADLAFEVQSFAKRLTKRKNRNSDPPPNSNFYDAQRNAFIFP